MDKTNGTEGGIGDLYLAQLLTDLSILGYVLGFCSYLSHVIPHTIN